MQGADNAARSRPRRRMLLDGWRRTRPRTSRRLRSSAGARSDEASCVPGTRSPAPSVCHRTSPITAAASGAPRENRGDATPPDQPALPRRRRGRGARWRRMRAPPYISREARPLPIVGREDRHTLPREGAARLDRDPVGHDDEPRLAGASTPGRRRSPIPPRARAGRRAAMTEMSSALTESAAARSRSTLPHLAGTIPRNRHVGLRAEPPLAWPPPHPWLEAPRRCCWTRSKRPE